MTKAGGIRLLKTSVPVSWYSGFPFYLNMERKCIHLSSFSSITVIAEKLKFSNLCGSSLLPVLQDRLITRLIFASGVGPNASSSAVHPIYQLPSLTAHLALHLGLFALLCPCAMLEVALQTHPLAPSRALANAQVLKLGTIAPSVQHTINVLLANDFADFPIPVCVGHLETRLGFCQRSRFEYVRCSSSGAGEHVVNRDALRSIGSIIL
jgi:hypothetical protein